MNMRQSGSAVILSSMLHHVSTLHHANAWGPKHVTEHLQCV